MHAFYMQRDQLFIHLFIKTTEEVDLARKAKICRHSICQINPFLENMKSSHCWYGHFACSTLDIEKSDSSVISFKIVLILYAEATFIKKNEIPTR